MIRTDDTHATRRELVDRLPVTGELVRGSLLERTVRNRSGCTVCAAGQGHPLSVLTVSYPGGRTRRFSLRREQVAEVRRWLGNYHKLKEAIEAICQFNHALLRPEDAGRSPHRLRKPVVCPAASASAWKPFGRVIFRRRGAGDIGCRLYL